MAPGPKPLSTVTVLAFALHLMVPSLAGAEGDAALRETESTNLAPEPLPEESPRLFEALGAVLQSLADERADLDALPSEQDSLVGSYFSETREEREAKID